MWTSVTPLREAASGGDLKSMLLTLANGLA
jgi:hypothetical protein